MHKIYIKEQINVRTPYHAYFACGSAAEFSVTRSEGYIEATLDETVELPFQVVYAPKMYGKVMKGLLVVDTLDVQWTYEYSGKMPDYIPPVIERSGRIDVSTPESVVHWNEIKSARKKNVVKENIDSARITRPRTALGTKIGLMRRPAGVSPRLEKPK